MSDPQMSESPGPRQPHPQSPYPEQPQHGQPQQQQPGQFQHGQPYPQSYGGQPNVQPPYGQAPYGQAPYGQAPYGYGPYGHQPYPPHVGPGFGQPLPYPVEMPKSVRTARTMVYILFGLTFAVAVVAGAADQSARTAGFVLGASITNIVAFVLALRFGTGRRGVQIGAIVCASLGILVALSRAAQGQPQLLVGAVVQGVLIARLATAEAKAWFTRPRTR
ncbi:hypothetical protein OG216_15255 [Streptomycetaceae bacterium NBC_01309]